MSEFSPRMGWTYPTAEDDPWFDTFVTFVEGVDSSSFAHREDRSIVWAGGGTLSWTLSTETLAWTDTINVYSPLGGRLLQVAAGSIAGWQEGEVVYLSLVRQVLANTTVTLTKALQVPSNDDAMALAVRVGGSIFFRTGISLGDGDSVAGVAPVAGGSGTDVNAIHRNVPGEIAAIAPKATPTGLDRLLVEDQADSDNKKSITIADLPAAAPASHASTHEDGGIDAMDIDAAPSTGSLRTLGTGSQQACAGDDSRLSDARTPTAHGTSHESGGTDAIKLDDLAAPDDNTDLNATTGAHGLLRKLDGVTTNFLRGDGAWATPTGGGGTDVRGANIVIGNSANGDTSDVCDALDTGNGTLLKSTIEGASAGDLVFVRAGTYDLGAGPQTRITIPAGVRVVCAGRGMTIIKAWTGADGRAIRITDGWLEDVTVEAPAPTVQTVAGDVVEVDTTFGRLYRVHVDFTGAWESVTPANVTIVSGFGFANCEIDVQQCKATGMSRGNDWQPFASVAAAQQRGFNLDTCSGQMADCRTTEGYYAFYLVDGRDMMFRDLHGVGHWHRGLYANGCYYSSFENLYFEQEMPPDFSLPPSSHDGIEFNLDSEVRVNGVTLNCGLGLGGPAPRYGISHVSAGKHIMNNVLVMQTSSYTKGVNYDVSSDFNVLTSGIIRNGVFDAGTGNDISHWITQ